MKNIAKALSKTIAVISLCLLVSCGFHLRGSVELPAGIEPIYIADQSNSFANTAKNLMNAYGIKLSDNINTANHHLVIIKQDQDKRSTALGEGARVIEYQLTESVTFELRDTKGKTIIGPNTITERKIIPNDPNKVASTNEEEKILRRDMLQNLAAKITRQLQSFDYQQ
jgi:LPS-assembly lipoprotein